MSVLREALKHAGFEDSQARLNEIAVEAMIANASDVKAAQEMIWRKVQSDAGMLSKLFAHYKDQAITNLIRDVQIAMRRVNKAPESKVRPIAQAISIIGSQWNNVEHDEHVAAVNREDERRFAEREVRRKAMEEARARYERSQLAKFKIDGRPLGD